MVEKSLRKRTEEKNTRNEFYVKLKEVKSDYSRNGFESGEENQGEGVEGVEREEKSVYGAFVWEAKSKGLKEIGWNVGKFEEKWVITAMDVGQRVGRKIICDMK
eukprot:gb/GEZJ01002884.1/.p6 GENE.gb/GEZJ01002884.1/~~gb/GEZJ01002884.1/.p6  ORF type:complete len:104 (-),score=23.51 gb/GEZJ01002884.1/:671-982(-)